MCSIAKGSLDCHRMTFENIRLKNSHRDLAPKVEGEADQNGRLTDGGRSKTEAALDNGSRNDEENCEAVKDQNKDTRQIQVPEVLSFKLAGTIPCMCFVRPDNLLLKERHT